MKSWTHLEPFYPDRMASRLLGMGDVMSLIEKAQQKFDAEKAAEMEKKMAVRQADTDGFLRPADPELKAWAACPTSLRMLPGM